MRTVEQVKQWVDWASNHDAAEESILTMMNTLLDEVERLRVSIGPNLERAREQGRESGKAEMLSKIKRLMREADMAHREYDETWEHFEQAIRVIPESAEAVRP